MYSTNVRAAVPGFDAMLRGIDLDKLKDERFDGFDHVALVEKQKERVASFRQAIIMRDFDELILELGAKWREKERLRRKGISVTKQAKSQAKEYDFPDELIQIALRSINAEGAV